MILGMYAGGILNAAMFYALFGFLWYGVFFRIPYMKWRYPDDEKRPPWIVYSLRVFIVHIILGVIISMVLGIFIRFIYAMTFIEGAEAGVWVWAGFVFTLGLRRLIFDKYPFRLFLINGGNALISLTVMGGVLAVWRY